MKREMSVNGAFYPDDAKELLRYFEHFTKVYDESLTLPILNSRAVIVPHAGYIYSGFTANIAYRLLAQNKVKTYVVIGPSHKLAFKGISLLDFESYATPFGEIAHDATLSVKLKKKFSLLSITDAHKEHSTELQFPLIKHYLDNAKIVELVYSQLDPQELSHIINYILQDENYGVIISTDLSHFYTQEKANMLDTICLNALKNLDVEKLQSGCEACGFTGVKAMMLSAKQLSLKTEILDYRTSADTSNDKSKVVGYMSACFIK